MISNMEVAIDENRFARLLPHTIFIRKIQQSLDNENHIENVVNII